METQGYGQYIQDQINIWPLGKPVTTTEIAVGLTGTFDIGLENAKKITNVNMKRLTDKGELVRVQRGVYGRVKETSFGRITPRPDDMLTGILLRNGESIIGYIAGPTLLNRIGLCSWIPAERHIATNRYRCRLPENIHIRVYKPIIPVDDENVHYLQALEAFMAMEQYPVDTDNPENVLRDMLRENNMDNERLIWYARCHCKQKILLKAIDIAIGGRLH